MLIFCFEKINLLPTSIHLFVVHAQELLSIKHYENIKKLKGSQISKHHHSVSLYMRDVIIF